MTGHKLSHYQIGEEISRGGMGVVYRATDVRLNRDVAVKVLPEDLMHDADRKRRFIQEAQAASALEHPHIAVIHDVDEAEGCTFIAMELIRGHKLSELLARHHLPPARALELASEIASGLARAHERGIVHRDLKPANVMVTDEGHAKLIDFGIAKLIDRVAPPSNALTVTSGDTAPGMVVGTTSYMSPEQARGEEVDHRSDVFSFGTLLHEMLTGQAPFQGRTGLETASAILHQPAPRLPPLGSGALPDASAEIQRILDKCLAKDPGDRYQGMKDIVVDLRAARRRLESTTQPVAAVPRARRIAPYWAAAGLIAAIGAAAAALFLMRDGRAEPSPGRDKPSVAVMHFENTTGDPDLEWLRTGIPEMVVTDLSQSPQIEVVGTDQVYDVMESLKRSDDRVLTPEVIRAVAERTGVSNVIVGSYVKAGNTIRINVRLQEARTGRIVSSERVEGIDQSSLFAMIDDLSRRLLSRFHASAGRGSGADLLARPGADPHDGLDRGLGDVTTTSIEAYRHYAEGINLHERYRETEAAAQFEKAIAIDPAFAMAYLKLAVVQNNLGNFSERDEYSALALKHADRLTPRERYYIEGFAYSNRRDGLARSMDAYRKCIDLDPGHHACRHNLGLQFLELNRYDEAVTHYEELVRRGTTNPTSIENLASAYMARGESDKALRLTEAYLARHPESGAGHESHGFNLMMAGRFDEAIAVYGRAALLDPTDPNIRWGRVLAEILAERWDAAREHVGEMTGSAQATRRWFGHQLEHLLALYQGRSADAVAAAERAAGAYQTPGQRTGMSRRSMALALLARGQDAAALAQARQALAVTRNTPMEPISLMAVAQVLARMGRRSDAEEAVGQLSAISEPLATNRDPCRIHYLRGLLAIEARDPTNAIQELERAQNLLPPRGPTPGAQSLHARVWYALAEAYVAAGREREAVETFQRITGAGYERAAAPVEFVRSFYFLGKLHEKAGDRPKAREAYRRFVGYWKDGDIDRERIKEAEASLDTDRP